MSQKQPTCSVRARSMLRARTGRRCRNCDTCGMRIVALVAALLVLVGQPIAQTPPPSSVLVFAAASMKGALDEVGALVTRRTGVAMKMSYAATSTLAKQ